MTRATTSPFAPEPPTRRQLAAARTAITVAALLLARTLWRTIR